MTQILTQTPAGFLPKVYYGLERGASTYRFIKDSVYNIAPPGNVGDAYELYSPLETDAYIPAVFVKLNDTQVQVIIEGDYNIQTDYYEFINMITGEQTYYTVENTTYQDASYLGSFVASDNQNKQITVLHDLATNRDNVVYASVDLNADRVYNWVTIGSYINGIDGTSIYGITSATISAVLSVAKPGDLLLAGEVFTDSDGNTYAIGDLNQIDALSPLTLISKGNVRGPQGVQGNPGTNGTNGQNGYTPYIQDGNWYINGVDTGVQAIGHDGTNGTNGQAFNMMSGLYSTPANWGEANNDDPDGNPLLQLPTLPTTGISGKGYVVYDPLTTPLYPFYDLYYANDNDVSWTIIHPFNGVNGQNGTNGYTPYIQDDDWYINGVDTGVQATGDAGAQGEQGWGFYVVSSNVLDITQDVPGARIGDYLINGTGGTLSIFTYPAVQPGGIVQITQDDDGSLVGNIRGPQGSTGATGPTGATPNISATATGLATGTSPTVNVSGTPENPILAFGIPKGDPGYATVTNYSNGGNYYRVYDVGDTYGTLIIFVSGTISSTIKTFDFYTVTGYRFTNGGNAGNTNRTFAVQGTDARLQVNLDVDTTFVKAQSDSSTSYNWWCMLVGQKYTS